MKRRIYAPLVATIMLVLGNQLAHATDYQQNELTITRVRAVGDYASTTYDNTVEIWFAGTLVYPSGSKCTASYAVVVDAKHKHIIAAAYFAFASGRKVNINVDDTLPNRTGMCEISFLDVI